MPGSIDPTDPPSNDEPTTAFTPPPLPSDTVDHAGGTHATGGDADFSVSPEALGPDPLGTASFHEKPGRRKKAAPEKIQVPGYEVLGELGRGAMGVVYKARQVKADRLVALKFMLGAEHADGGARERFDREAQAVARLQHPNIVQVFEVGELAGTPYFTLEYVTGGTLAGKITKNLLPPQQAGATLRTLARAMHDAHQHQVIHRDLKPGNILLTAEGEPKIADFGLAKKLEDADSGSTRAGTVVGTPSYMAPEQARGDVEHVGPPADIYALGAILYELLAGRPPFKGATIYETIEQVQNVEPIPPSTLQPKVPIDLETICLKCLQKEPGKRYATAAELADDVQRYLDGVPIQARPIGPAERLWRWCKRNPRIAGLVGAVGLLLVLLAGGGLTAAYVINQSRNEVVEQKKEVEQQKQVAEGRLELVRKAVDTFVTDVPEALKNAPLAGPVRDAVNVMQSITNLLSDVQDQADDAGIVRRGLTGSLRREGELLVSRGDLKGAKAKYEEARKLAADALHDEKTQKDKAAGNLAVALTALAEIAHLERQADDAIQYFKEALALRRGIVEAPQSGEIPPADAKASLGLTYWALAQTLRERKQDAPAALENAAQAEALLRAALASDQITPKLREQHRMNLGLAALEVGRCRFLLGQIDDGKKAFERAIRVLTELVKDSPRNGAYRLNLQVATAEYGDLLLRDLGQPAEAGKHYQVAVEQSRALARSPDIVNYQQRLLALNHYRMGTAALRSRDKAAAAKHYAAALAWRESYVRDLEATADPNKQPDIIRARTELMIAQARCGRRAEALDMAGRLLKVAPTLKAGDPRKANWLFAAASGFALAADPADPAKRKEQLGTALKALRLAVESGYPRNLAATNPDLDPLREDSEHGKLLLEVVQLPKSSQR